MYVPTNSPNGSSWLSGGRDGEPQRVPHYKGIMMSVPLPVFRRVGSDLVLQEPTGPCCELPRVLLTSATIWCSLPFLFSELLKAGSPASCGLFVAASVLGDAEKHARSYAITRNRCRRCLSGFRGVPMDSRLLGLSMASLVVKSWIPGISDQPRTRRVTS